MASEQRERKVYARYLAVAVLTMLMTGLPVSSAPQSADLVVTTGEPEGLKGVGVLIEDLDIYVEADGLRREDIQRDVELKLRQSGIRVLTAAQRWATRGMPNLYVRVVPVKIPDAS